MHEKVGSNNIDWPHTRESDTPDLVLPRSVYAQISNRYRLRWCRLRLRLVWATNLRVHSCFITWFIIRSWWSELAAQTAKLQYRRLMSICTRTNLNQFFYRPFVTRQHSLIIKIHTILLLHFRPSVRLWHSGIASKWLKVRRILFSAGYVAILVFSNLNIAIITPELGR